MKKQALISDCGKHRYQLHRIWDDQLPVCLFVMLNPSTADAEKDDHTIRRCIGFAKSWGYGGLMVGNLFSLRATNPNELKTWKVDHYHIDQNAQSIMEMYYKCSIVVCAWGNPPISYGTFPLEGVDLHYLVLTKHGNPGHPLRLHKSLKPIKFDRKLRFG